MTNKTLPERFWEKVDKGGGCWLWTAYRSKDGYGIFGIGQKIVKAHRVSYELSVGKIPKGMMVCHHCDNPPCVNPKHLFIGDGKANAVDMTRKGRRFKPYNKGSKHGNARLNEAKVLEMRKFKLGAGKKMSYRAIGELFNVNCRTAGRAIKKESWTHI